MMKKITLLFVVLFAFGFYSCNESQIDSVESSELEFEESLLKKPAVKAFESVINDSGMDFCGKPVECAFIAGQHIDAGSVTVSNDENYLYVKVYSKAGFQDVSENIKMWIGLEAPNRRPPSGQFPYKVTENGDTHIFKIELSTLPDWDECGKQYDIIVHGDVLTEEGNSGSGETAYGGCELTGDKPWWAYMTYTTECCEEEETKLGWLYKEGSFDRNICFGLNEDEMGISSRFPYTRFPYEKGKTYPIFGDFGDDCNTEGVVKIGEVTVYLLDWKDSEEARVKLVFNFDSKYEVSKGYIYIGWLNPIISGGFDPSLINDILELDIIGGSGEFIFYEKTWPGDKGDGGPIDLSGWDQYFISASFIYSE